MNGYIQAEEVAEKWNISSRQVQYLCKLGRIEGAIKLALRYFKWVADKSSPAVSR